MGGGQRVQGPGRARTEATEDRSSSNVDLEIHGMTSPPMSSRRIPGGPRAILLFVAALSAFVVQSELAQVRPVLPLAQPSASRAGEADLQPTHLSMFKVHDVGRLLCVSSRCPSC